jgi:hypothetical protein
VCCVWAQTIQHSIFELVNNVVSFVIFVGVAQSAQRIVLIVFVDVVVIFASLGGLYP